MHIDFAELRKCVLNRFATKADFGERMGWNACKVTRILHGYQFPKLDEIWRIATVCNLSGDQVVSIFFAEDER